MVTQKNTNIITMPNNFINRIFNELHISHLTIANTVFGYWYAWKGSRKIISLITCILLMSTGMPKYTTGLPNYFDGYVVLCETCCVFVIFIAVCKLHTFRTMYTCDYTG